LFTSFLFLVFFCLDAKEAKNQGQTNAPLFVRPRTETPID